MWLSVARFVQLLLHFLPLFGKEIRKRSALISESAMSERRDLKSRKKSQKNVLFAVSELKKSRCARLSVR